MQEKNSETEMNDEEWRDENGADNSEEENEVPIRQSRGLSEYEKRREKNIEENKRILAGLNINRIREDLTPKPAVKKSASKKKKDDAPVERRVSTRNKGKDNVDKG